MSKRKAKLSTKLYMVSSTVNKIASMLVDIDIVKNKDTKRLKRKIKRKTARKISNKIINKL